jgi:hypothetical protein
MATILGSFLWRVMGDLSGWVRLAQRNNAVNCLIAVGFLQGLLSFDLAQIDIGLLTGETILDDVLDRFFLQAEIFTGFGFGSVGHDSLLTVAGNDGFGKLLWVGFTPLLDTYPLVKLSGAEVMTLDHEDARAR